MNSSFCSFFKNLYYYLFIFFFTFNSFPFSIYLSSIFFLFKSFVRDSKEQIDISKIDLMRQSFSIKKKKIRPEADIKKQRKNMFAPRVFYDLAG